MSATDEAGSIHERSMNEIAHKLARGKKSRNWWMIGFFIQTVLMISLGIFYAIESKKEERMAIFDVSSGSIVVSPVVDPVESKEILDTEATWCVQAILDRSPAGLDDEAMVQILFNPDAMKKLEDEWTAVRAQYQTKKMRAHVEIKSLDHQTIATKYGPGLQSTVVCQEVISGPIGTEVKATTVTLTFATNPNFNHRKRFPLMCFDYTETDGNQLAQK